MVRVLCLSPGNGVQVLDVLPNGVAFSSWLHFPHLHAAGLGAEAVRRGRREGW